ncbi:TIGR01777 family oxidoreductase [Thermodesulforhabdus norvegica]|uniref:TIGR01777 family protein n=1 Tax=Thermodesulforhabdus norvegica TaxID=39841 RepID=A0A1I4SPU2_9BACT|nr:TIGR01777 family oxidoreductase [Thermodesulforhabdus norvegica]SFM66407.1 hypothetical protein SAMN05660836_01093 [Thermodesulforhabdus norvegica]
MKIFMTGGLGFVGSYLTSYFLSKNYRITVVGLQPERPESLDSSVSYVYGDTTKKGEWMSLIGDHDVVINLAGASIFQRWNRRVKQVIMESRVKTTENVVEALPSDGSVVLISTSAVGYYGDGGERILREDDGPGRDFLSQVCVAWEQAALRAQQKGSRVVVTRFGIVLGKHGGALVQMLRPFRYGLGAVMGSGNQWFSWIHIEDLAGAMEFIIGESSLSGPVNLCAPNPVRNRELTRTIAHYMGKPAFLRLPGWLLRLVLGEMSNALTVSQRVIPDKLLRYGFRFKYPDIDEALRAILVGN